MVSIVSDMRATRDYQGEETNWIGMDDTGGGERLRTVAVVCSCWSC